MQSMLRIHGEFQQKYMMEMISARRSSHEIAPHDILSMLIEAMDNKENSSDELDHQGLLGACHCIRRDMA